MLTVAGSFRWVLGLVVGPGIGLPDLFGSSARERLSDPFRAYLKTLPRWSRHAAIIDDLACSDPSLAEELWNSLDYVASGVMGEATHRGGAGVVR